MTMSDETKTNLEYRRILVTANKLETIQSNLESVIDFFLAPLVKLYSKLCTDCLKLMFESEFRSDHFRKAEDLIWRRVYHDIYRFHKNKRQQIKKQDEFLIEAHFISGIGFYSSLIVRLRSHYKIRDAPGLSIPLNLGLGPIDNFVEDQPLDWGLEKKIIRYDDISMKVVRGPVNGGHDRSPVQEWARQAIYRSLIYMGDLSRYLIDTSQPDFRQLAFEFYYSASQNQPDHGLPFNQLATLSGGLNHNLDSVCNYMRCCLRPKPFEGAEGNMRKLFKLNQKSYECLLQGECILKISDVLASKEPSIAAEGLIRSVIVSFVKLTSELWLAITDENNDLVKEEIVKITQFFFEGLREALELEPVHSLAAFTSEEQKFLPISGCISSSNKPKYISPTIMYELCSISLMLIAKCQRQTVENGSARNLNCDYISNLANTLALNLLHYSTTKCHRMILSKIQELKLGGYDHSSLDRSLHRKNDFFTSGDLSSNSSQKTTGSSNFVNENATNKRALSRLRQRQAATNYSNTGISSRLKPLVFTNEDSDMSELEETALSTIDALDISSEISDEAGYQTNDLINLDSSSGNENDEIKTGELLARNPIRTSTLRKPSLRPARSQNYEHERSLNFNDSCSNSLPIPDLLTGDNVCGIFDCRSRNTSQSPLDSLGDYDSRTWNASERGVSSPGQRSGLDSALTFIYTHTYLPTIKIFCDWLLSNADVISSNLLSFRTFSTELNELVSLLTDLLKLVDKENSCKLTSSSKKISSGAKLEEIESNIYNHTFKSPDWIQKFPLSCDFPLFNLAPLRKVHELNIHFENPKKLTEAEAGFLTTQCMIAFSHVLNVFLQNKLFD